MTAEKTATADVEKGEEVQQESQRTPANKKVNILIIGMAGSGKSTFMQVSFPPVLPALLASLRRI